MFPNEALKPWTFLTSDERNGKPGNQPTFDRFLEVNVTGFSSGNMALARWTSEI